MSSFIARYHELTKYDPRSIDRLGPVRWSEQPSPFKEIVGTESVNLLPSLPFLSAEDPSEWASRGLRPGPPFDLSALARVSWFSAGINALVRGTRPPLHLRATPSAGGLYPVELYWAVFDVPGIDPGLYLFHPAQLTLVPVWRGAFRPDLSALLGHHPAVDASPAVAVLTGQFGRGAWRYKERAYRRMLLDAGHLAGNLELALAAECLEVLPLPSFHDQGLSDLFFLDREEEVPLLALALGTDLDHLAPRQARSPVPAADRLRVPEGCAFQVHAHRLAELPPPPFEWVAPAAPAAWSPAADDLPLPPASGDLPAGLHQAMATRRSPRAFRRGPLPSSPILDILAWALEDADPGRSVRISSRLSTWIALHDIEGVPSGIWKLAPSGRFLSPVRSGDFRAECATVCLGQELASDANAVIFHTTDLDAAVAESGERCYRALCLDAGAVGQRIALAAHAAGLGFSGIGGYFDDEANQLLGLPPSEAILYISTLGHP